MVLLSLVEGLICNKTDGASLHFSLLSLIFFPRHSTFVTSARNIVFRQSPFLVAPSIKRGATYLVTIVSVWGGGGSVISSSPYCFIASSLLLNIMIDLFIYLPKAKLCLN